MRGGGHVAKLAAVAVCGGVPNRNIAPRAGCEASADLPAIGHGPEEKCCLCAYVYNVAQCDRHDA